MPPFTSPPSVCPYSSCIALVACCVSTNSTKTIGPFDLERNWRRLKPGQREKALRRPSRGDESVEKRREKSREKRGRRRTVLEMGGAERSREGRKHRRQSTDVESAARCQKASVNLLELMKRGAKTEKKNALLRRVHICRVLRPRNRSHARRVTPQRGTREGVAAEPRSGKRRAERR